MKSLTTFGMISLTNTGHWGLWWCTMQRVAKSLPMKTVGNMDISAQQTCYLQHDNSLVTSPRHSIVFMYDVRMSPIRCDEVFGRSNIKMLFEFRAWKDFLAWWAFNLLISWCSSLHKCFEAESHAEAYINSLQFPFCAYPTNTIIEPLLLQNFSTCRGVGL